MNSQSSIMSEIIRRIIKGFIFTTDEESVYVPHTKIANGITFHVDELGKVLADRAMRNLTGVQIPESKRPNHVGVTVTTNGTIVYTGVCTSKPTGIYNKPTDLCPVRATVDRNGRRTEYISSTPPQVQEPKINHVYTSNSIGRDGKRITQAA